MMHGQKNIVMFLSVCRAYDIPEELTVLRCSCKNHKSLQKSVFSNFSVKIQVRVSSSEFSNIYVFFKRLYFQAILDCVIKSDILTTANDQATSYLKIFDELLDIQRTVHRGISLQ